MSKCKNCKYKISKINGYDYNSGKRILFFEHNIHINGMTNNPFVCTKPEPELIRKKNIDSEYDSDKHYFEPEKED